MKKILPFCFALVGLTSCHNSEPPKKVATDFIQAVYSGDAGKATMLTTTTTQASINGLQTHASATTADESFSFATLAETVSGDNAEVKNEGIKLLLQKEAGAWKVAASPAVVKAINNRQAVLADVQQKWETLLREYKARLLVAKDFVQYKKGRGSLSVPLQNLEAAVNSLLAQTDGNRQPVAAYVAAQRAVDDLLDKAYEPSYTASADISMNYFLQLNQSADGVKKLLAGYNDAAAKAPSLMYPVVP